MFSFILEKVMKFGKVICMNVVCLSVDRTASFLDFFSCCLKFAIYNVYFKKCQEKRTCIKSAF